MVRVIPAPSLIGYSQSPDQSRIEGERKLRGASGAGVTLTNWTLPVSFAGDFRSGARRRMRPRHYFTVATRLISSTR